LYLVYRENILRYFQPFDHKGPIYTYFIFLPVYLLPWTFFFIPTLVSLRSRWRSMFVHSKCMCWAVLLLFVFLTLSGSRRNYYILPVVPFAILMTADWILASIINAKRNLWAGKVALISFLLLFTSFDVVQPLYYAQGGMRGFAAELKERITIRKPWSDWQFVMLDPESKVRFYLDLPPTVKNYPAIGQRNAQTEQTLLQAWPMMQEKKTNVVFITRKMYEPLLRNILVDYQVIEAPKTLGERLLKIDNQNAPVAFLLKG
jgi:hypothetical protein